MANFYCTLCATLNRSDTKTRYCCLSAALSSGAVWVAVLTFERVTDSQLRQPLPAPSVRPLVIDAEAT